MHLLIYSWLLTGLAWIVVGDDIIRLYQERLAKRLMSQLEVRDNSTSQATNTSGMQNATAPTTYLNARSKQFVVDGKKLPQVSFDVGESYAGLLPTSNKSNETRKLFFWFFPSKDQTASSDEIVVWFNGGPGCSSFIGLLTENGPFLWQDGTEIPVPNPYSWSRLTNVMWIEQPAGTGFSQGSPVKDEYQVAEDFKGFWKNFVDVFGLHKRKVYLTGESYAGMYVPYIADSFLKANNTNYFNLKGIMLNNAQIGDGGLAQDLLTAPIALYWSHLLGYDQPTIAKIQNAYQAAGYAKYVDTYFRFPPPPRPWAAQPNPANEVYGDVSLAWAASNPCFNIYHMSDMCPYIPGRLNGLIPSKFPQPKPEIYFQRADVQKAINAPQIGTKWMDCNGAVFPADQSLTPAKNGMLTNIVAKTGNVLLGGGRLDSWLPPNGTLFVLQNMTWGGKQGFQQYPNTPFFVPAHKANTNGFLGGNGNLGTWRKERGLTFFDIQLAGHELPGYAPSAGYRLLQGLLGRISDFSSQAPLF